MHCGGWPADLTSGRKIDWPADRTQLLASQSSLTNPCRTGWPADQGKRLTGWLAADRLTWRQVAKLTDRPTEAEHSFWPVTGGAVRHFSANYMPFAGAEFFVCEHACVRAENILGHFLICGAEFWFFRTSIRQKKYNNNLKFLQNARI
jgi:hypothetical protein